MGLEYYYLILFILNYNFSLTVSRSRNPTLKSLNTVLTECSVARQMRISYTHCWSASYSVSAPVQLSPPGSTPWLGWFRIYHPGTDTGGAGTPIMGAILSSLVPKISTRQPAGDHGRSTREAADGDP